MRASQKPAPTLLQADIDFVKKALRHLGVRREADVDDVTGVVLLDLVRAFDQYDDARPLRPWLYAFARHRAWAYRRRRSVRARLERPLPETEAQEPVAAGPDPHQHAVARDRLATLDALLSELAPVETEVLLLYEGTAMELADVAGVLGIPYGTASSRLFFARKNLRAARARLEARLAHRGESWAVVPPLALLFGTTEAWHHDPGEPPSAPGVSAATPPPGATRPWTVGGLLAALGGITAAAAAAVLFSRCDPPSPPPIVHAVTVTETAPAPPSESAEPSPLPGAEPPPPATSAPPPAPSAPPRDDLSAEEVKAQIYAARMSFARGDALAALTVLDRLERHDRRGLFADDRELLRVEVLARVGRLPEARARLGRLRRARPDEPRLKRLDRVLGASR